MRFGARMPGCFHTRPQARPGLLFLIHPPDHRWWCILLLFCGYAVTLACDSFRLVYTIIITDIIYNASLDFFNFYGDFKKVFHRPEFSTFPHSFPQALLFHKKAPPGWRGRVGWLRRRLAQSFYIPLRHQSLDR